MTPLLEKAGDLLKAATELGAGTGVGERRELRALLRRMNSYYTKRMEGEHTRPSDIDRALHNQYSENLDLARRQRLAVAHIHAEETAERLFAASTWSDGSVVDPYAQGTLSWLHQQLFSALSEQDRTLSNHTLLEPGVLRLRQGAVGRHEASWPKPSLHFWLDGVMSTQLCVEAMPLWWRQPQPITDWHGFTHLVMAMDE